MIPLYVKTIVYVIFGKVLITLQYMVNTHRWLLTHNCKNAGSGPKLSKM